MSAASSQMPIHSASEYCRANPKSVLSSGMQRAACYLLHARCVLDDRSHITQHVYALQIQTAARDDQRTRVLDALSVTDAQVFITH